MEATRRGLLLGGAAAAAALPLAGLIDAEADAAQRRRRRKKKRPRKRTPAARPLPPIGSGGALTPPSRLAQLAREVGDGEDVLFCDLAAVDRNLAVVTGFARSQGWDVRPALKSFQSPPLAAYLLERLPRPRGLVFQLRLVDEILGAAPEGTDLLQAYPPAIPELARYLATPRPRAPQRHRVRILVDSLPLLTELARLAPASKRGLPIDVVLQLEAGLELSGFRTPEELRAALDLLRRHRDTLRLTGFLAYDGHGTFRPDAAYRQRVADDARRRQAAWNAQLRAEAGDLIDPRDFIRNGPGSSTYQRHAGNPEITEVSPGVALVPHGYVTQDGFDNAGLVPVLHNAACVHRVAVPTVPLVSAPDPQGGGRDNVSCKGGGGNTPVFPAGLEPDTLSGNNGGYNQGHYYAPKGALRRGDHIVFRAREAGPTTDAHGALVAVREGMIRRVWPTQGRPGSAARLGLTGPSS